MHERPITRGRNFVALAIVVLLLTAGCARSGATSQGTASGPLTLNVGQISNSAAFFPIFVAENQGYFKDQGLTLGDRPRLGTGAKLAAALQSGSIDVAGGVMTDAFNLYKINNKARVIGALVDSYYVDIVAGPNIPTSLDSAPLAQKVRALKGKKIGITGPGSGTEALVTYLFKQQGLDPKTDVTMVNLGSDASAALGALKAGRVDALSFFQPIGQEAEATNIGRIFISPTRGDVPELKGATHGVLFTTQNVLDSKGKAVAAFLRGIAQAEKLITSDQTQTKALLQKYQPALNPQTLDRLVPVLQKEIPANPTPQQHGYQVSANFHQQSGLIASPPPFSTMVPSSWISTALKGASVSPSSGG